LNYVKSQSGTSLRNSYNDQSLETVQQRLENLGLDSYWVNAAITGLQRDSVHYVWTQNSSNTVFVYMREK